MNIIKGELVEHYKREVLMPVLPSLSLSLAISLTPSLVLDNNELRKVTNLDDSNTLGCMVSDKVSIRYLWVPQ